MGGGSGAEDEESNAGHHERGGLVLVDERVGIASMSAALGVAPSMLPATSDIGGS